MINPKSPGVYIDEISTLPASIAPVATAIPAFVGYTKADTYQGETLTDKPTRITSLLEYQLIFGGPYDEKFEITLTGTVAVTTVEVNLAVPPAPDDPALSPYTMYYNLQLYFANGGGPCYIVSVGTYSDAVPFALAVGRLTAGLATVEKEDEVTLLVVPEAVSLAAADRLTVNDAMLAQCAKLQDRFAIIDAVVLGGTVAADGAGLRADVGADNLKYGAAYYPSLLTSQSYYFEDENLVIADDRGGDGLGPLDGKTLDIVLNGEDGAPVITPDKALYNNIVKALRLKFGLTLYPSSAIAGIYARVDRERGVWKAPANTGVRMVDAPAVLVTTEQQDGLNIDATSGKSINVIRRFTGKGNIVWGARTLAGNDNEWKFIPVRRLFIFVEESVKKATEFVVFEPNDANTWIRCKTMVENFLTQLWRNGALAGAKPEDAFFVKVGLGTTMTAVDILEGKLNIEIGMAAVRPAEFIILRFSHKLQES